MENKSKLWTKTTSQKLLKQPLLQQTLPIKVAAIVGPATSGATAAAVANATKAGVPLISPSATRMV